MRAEPKSRLSLGDPPAVELQVPAVGSRRRGTGVKETIRTAPCAVCRKDRRVMEPCGDQHQALPDSVKERQPTPATNAAPIDRPSLQR